MLIGRESEQQALARAMAGARVEEASALVLVGEPGIGKSALLADAVDRAGDMQLLRAAGSTTEQGVAFAGLLQLLRPVLGHLDQLPARQADALSVALALRDGVIVDRFAVGAACLSLLSRCAEDRSLLVVVDDAHLWDRASAEAVAFAVRRLMADRVAFLAASRPEPDVVLLESDLPQLHLGGLGPVASEQLVRRTSGHRVGPETLDLLRAATGGNPLALEELSRDLSSIERLPPGLPVPVPEALARSFRRRTGELPVATRRALLLAVLAGGDLALATRAARGIDGVDIADLAVAERAGLLRMDLGRVELRHPLVASGVYADADPTVRRRAHHAIADALPEEDLERRAWHRAAAATGPDAAVADDLVEVARRAGQRGAHAVAVTAYERAALLTPLDTGIGADSRGGRHLAAAEAAWLSGQVARAEQLLDGAVADPRMQHAVDGLRGSMALRSGSLESARSLLRRTAEAVAADDPTTAVDLLADLVTACFYLGAGRDGLAVAGRLDELLTGPLPEVTRARALMAAGMARVLAGETGIEQIRAAVEALEALPDLGDDRRRPAWQLVGPLFLRESASGRELVEHALGELRSSCALGALPNLLFSTARDDATSQRWQEATSAYDEGARLARETGQSTDLAMCLAGLAWLEARMGRAVECRAHAGEVLELAQRHHIHLGRAWVTCALGDLALAEGGLEAAIGHYTSVEDLLAAIGFLDVDLSPGPELVEALLHAGRLEEAGAAARDYRLRAGRKGQPWALARAERALGMVAEGRTEREGHFRRALQLHRETPDDFETARTRLAHGAALRRARSRVAARVPLREALATFDRLGATPWAERAAVELEATGETVQRSGESPLASLTPQEAQIADLLGAGRTTKEAAGVLFLSPKTVEYHLRHIYTKLGIRSRAELAEAVRGR